MKIKTGRHESIRCRDALFEGILSSWEVTFENYCNGGYFVGIFSERTTDFQMAAWDGTSDGFGLYLLSQNFRLLKF